MEKFKAFLKRKDIEISLKRYGIDALGAMAQGLFCSLLIGTIINTIGTQFHIPFLTMAVATVNDTQYKCQKYQPFYCLYMGQKSSFSHIIRLLFFFGSFSDLRLSLFFIY